MPQFSSRELYMMNSGNTVYIYKDGFGDIYHATPAEEKIWSGEVVENALIRINGESNATLLRSAIDDLVFHDYGPINNLLLEKMKDTSPVRTIVFATSLWTIMGYERSFGIIHRQFMDHREECFDEFFHALIDLKNHTAARKFLIECLLDDDTKLHTRAYTTLSMWAYTGMPQLRADGLLDALKQREEPRFSVAIRYLKQLLLL